MIQSSRLTLRWVARVIAIVIFFFVLFRTVLYFAQPKSSAEQWIFLVLTCILFITLYIAWNLERIGGALFIAAGIFSLIIEPWLLGFALMATGLLFIFSRETPIKIQRNIQPGPELLQKVEQKMAEQPVILPQQTVPEQTSTPKRARPLPRKHKQRKSVSKKAGKARRKKKKA